MSLLKSSEKQMLFKLLKMIVKVIFLIPGSDKEKAKDEMIGCTIMT